MPRLDAEPKDLDNGDLEFEAIIEVYPEISEIDAGALKIDRPEAEVTEADVEEMLKTLREQRRTWEEVERAAQEGDQVILDFAADSDDGRVPEEGFTRMSIVLGSSGFDELDKVMTGLEAGGKKKKKMSFPEGFRETSLAGKKAKAELEVVKVSEPNTPEVDEEFVKSFGVEEGTAEALKEEIRGNLERELSQATL
jgi:trigger factor